MSMIKTGNGFANGIEFMDQQHTFFVASMNRLLEAMKNGEGKEEIRKTMRFVELHILKYFPREEEFMGENNYHDIDFHITQHKKFRADFEEIKDIYFSKGYSVSLPLTLQRKMQDWMTNHICKADRILADYVNSVRKTGGGSAG